MEDIEKRRARCREYGKAHKEELSRKRRQRYRRDSDFRERCKLASYKYYYKRKRELIKESEVN